jgi:hypothetical protein
MTDFAFVTVDQAAEMLGQSNRAVLYAIDRGEFPNARKVDANNQTSPWLIPTADLKAYQKQKATPAKASK